MCPRIRITQECMTPHSEMISQVTIRTSNDPLYSPSLSSKSFSFPFLRKYTVHTCPRVRTTQECIAPHSEIISQVTIRTSHDPLYSPSFTQ